MKKLQKAMADLISGDERRAEAAAHDLTGLGERALLPIKQLYGSLDADERWWALRAAAEIQSEDSKSLLLAGLSDEDQAVRCCAALGLRLQPAAEAVPELMELLETSNRLLARLAGDALASVGEKAVPGLLAVMENGPQYARIEATRALAIIGDQRAIPILFNALDEDSALVEYWANEGLERMGIGMVFYKP